MDKEDPEQLFEIFEDIIWDSKDDIVRDISDKLKEFGYLTVDASKYASDGECYINFMCEHGIVCGHVWIYACEDGEYEFDISDSDANDDSTNECSMCKKVKTIKICKEEDVARVSNQKAIDDSDKIVLDRRTVEEIIKLIESEEYLIVDDDIIISDEEGIVLTLKEILKGKHENYKV